MPGPVVPRTEDGPANTNDTITTEHQQDSDPLRDTIYNNVQHFINSHGLTQHVQVFRKAALVLEGQTSFEDIPLDASESRALHEEIGRKWHQPKMLYFTILVCSIGAVEQGWAQTGMNGANLYFPKAFGIDSDSKHDNFVVGLINSGIYLSVAIL